jgi:hypothetical protein
VIGVPHLRPGCGPCHSLALELDPTAAGMWVACGVALAGCIGAALCEAWFLTCPCDLRPMRDSDCREAKCMNLRLMMSSWVPKAE